MCCKPFVMALSQMQRVTGLKYGRGTELLSVFSYTEPKTMPGCSATKGQTRLRNQCISREVYKKRACDLSKSFTRGLFSPFHG